MTEVYIFWLATFVLVGLDLVTVAARVGLLNTSLPRLLAQRETATVMADRTIRLIQALPRLQASLNLARLIWRFLLAGLIFQYVYRLVVIYNSLIASTVLLAAAFLLFWLEWIIGVVVLRDTDMWAMRLTLFARVLSFVLTPVIALPLYMSGDAVGVPEGMGTLVVTEDDLKTMVDAGQQEGLLQQDERRMIHSIFELGNTLAREIMVPRIDVLALDVKTALPEAVDALLKTGYSRVPVYEETVDNVLGLLYAKDLLRVWREGSHLESLSELLRPAYFVPEAKKVDELLTEMQAQRVHMAVVVDEYGGVAGLVTLEDIVEEILGEILDEYDQAEESPYEEISGGGYIFQGRIDLDDFNEVVAGDLPKDEADTLGGFIYSVLGRVPANGEQVQVDSLLLTVEQVSGRRIRKVRVEHIPADEVEKNVIRTDE